jgi:hypothetical protein
MDISDRSPHPGTCMRVGCQYRRIISDRVSSHSPGALSDASTGIARVVRGLLRSEKNGLSRSRGVFSSSLPPSGAAVS